MFACLPQLSSVGSVRNSTIYVLYKNHVITDIIHLVMAFSFFNKKAGTEYGSVLIVYHVYPERLFTTVVISRVSKKQHYLCFV